jgi:dephospho-CoA kinase
VVVIGLTGGIGAGKSTVGAMLVARGAVLIDGDRIVREIQEPGAAAFDPIVERFGPGVVAADGTLDRSALAAIVFSDPAALADLNAITHPLVLAGMQRRVAACAGTDDVVVLDIPLLAEGGRERWDMAGVVVVDAPIDVAVQRLVAQRGMADDDARARIANQATREQRRALADVVIDNSGDLEQLEGEVDRAWKWIDGMRKPAE